MRRGAAVAASAGTSALGPPAYAEGRGSPAPGGRSGPALLRAGAANRNPKLPPRHARELRRPRPLRAHAPPVPPLRAPSPPRAPTHCDRQLGGRFFLLRVEG
ncbi:hypothetical protein P7K49_010574 [Saguinus oedipus]|uniref:Uncharacterized protein n=1 Tax=Saguinus oedipus TaxID=9490 RepID=A0ABQ9VQJ2_SAGOE|nr:hypothetical protein P7K49_010574 [Saguinus oedipus]